MSSFTTRIRRPTTGWLAAFLFLALLAAWSRASVAADEAVPDLTGAWELDGDLSEEPMDRMRGPRGGMRGGMGGPPGGMGSGRPGGMGGVPPGGRGGRGGRGGPEGGQSPEETRQRMEALRKSVERLEIRQAADSVRIVFADGTAQEFTTDNEKNVVQTVMGEAEIKATWKNDGLVVKTRAGERKTTETYVVTTDKSLLTVLVTMDGPGPMGSVSFKRVYRPAVGAGPSDGGSGEAVLYHEALYHVLDERRALAETLRVLSPSRSRVAGRISR